MIQIIDRDVLEKRIHVAIEGSCSMGVLLFKIGGKICAATLVAGLLQH
jgi:hypothetical protein